MNELESYIKQQIRKSGPITFEKYMRHALYHPELGYYSSGNVGIGKKGDFYTSPHVSSVFGEIIATFIEKIIEFIGAKEISVIEIGAGKGYLAQDILNYFQTKADIYSTLNYIIVDSNFTADQNVELDRYADRLNIFNNISMLDSVDSAVIISNELFDSLPFHRIVYMDNEYREIYVDLENDSFNEINGDLSVKNIKNYINSYKIDTDSPYQFEVNLSAEELLRDMNGLFDRGYILSIDYGSLADDYFSGERTNGTFRCFYKHSLSDNPYINIGFQDITADVNFTQLIEVGKQLGIEPVKYTTQGQFLVDWGIIELIEQKSITENAKSLNSIKNLFLPGMMGNYFKVLIQSKKIPQGEEIYPDSKLKLSFGIK